MKRYVHWLRIYGVVSSLNEYRQYMEIAKYLKANPNAVATIWRYKYGCAVNRVVKLVCDENADTLGLRERCFSHSLRRMQHKPGEITNEKPFYIPAYVLREHEADS